MKKLIIILSTILTGCMVGAGTLGGFETVSFPTSKQNIVTSIDSIYKLFPNYKIPDHWKRYDTWSERGYDFLDSRIFYFKSEPEEMYYVTFIGDSLDQKNPHYTAIAIRSYMKGNNLGPWLNESDTGEEEKKRIESRFRTEIASKIETFSKKTSSTQE
jgi:hypothetical protein